MAASSPDPLADLTVIVVNYGTHELVEVNLIHSLGSDFPGTVVVVDNFSNLEERRRISEVCEYHGWTCITLETNEGFGEGNNRGAEIALERGAAELLLLNPDAWIERKAVRRLQAQVRADPMLLVAPRVLRPHGGLYSDENDLYLDNGEMLWRRLRGSEATPERIHTWVSAACVMISSKLWQACGGFDPDYFLYWEDVDLSRRVTSAGGRVRVDVSISAVHDEGSSQRNPSAPQQKSPAYYYYNCRNRLVYAAKHLSVEDQRRWLRATPRASYRLAKQGGRRQLLNPSLNLWPALKGARDGIRYVRASRRRRQGRKTGVRT